MATEAARCRIVLAVLAIACCLSAGRTTAEPYAAAGDPGLRFDLEYLQHAGHLDIPLTTWPVSWPDVEVALGRIDESALSPSAYAAYLRVRQDLRMAAAPGYSLLSATAGVATKPRVIRSFEDTPRENAEAGISIGWQGNRFAYRLAASGAASPQDGDRLRPDGSYVAMAAGNWMLSAGWQSRWWGPGRGGSLLLSSNARPVPSLAVQRRTSAPFESRWLRWIGPWTLHSFVGWLDDERVVDDALLFGVRAVFRPVRLLEIGLSRTAMWCGDDRPCSGSTFVDLLVGNDNRGVNVDPDDEPGNQLAGIDMRWQLPGKLPLAVYGQWIGEDTRRGGPEIGSWLRQFGVEYQGRLGALQHRSYVEVAETSCRDGGFGFSEIAPNCAYEHGIYQTGYRYEGRALGHGMDGDGLAYSLGSTLVQSAGHRWNFTLRFMEINRTGMPSERHTLSATPQDLADLLVTHARDTRFGRFHIGLGVSRLDDEASGRSSTDATGFIRWTTDR